MRGKSLLRSFQNAGRGLLCAVRQERNLRIHLLCMCYIVALGALARLSAARWATVLLCFGAVIGAELMNTALELICDALCPAQNPKIGAAKDASAAAVLVLASASAGVACAVFGPWIYRGGLVAGVGAHPWILPVGLLSLPIAILWIRGSKKWKLKNRA